MIVKFPKIQKLAHFSLPNDKEVKLNREFLQESSDNIINERTEQSNPLSLYFLPHFVFATLRVSIACPEEGIPSIRCISMGDKKKKKREKKEKVAFNSKSETLRGGKIEYRNASRYRATKGIAYSAFSRFESFVENIW